MKETIYLLIFLFLFLIMQDYCKVNIENFSGSSKSNCMSEDREMLLAASKKIDSLEKEINDLNKLNI